MNDWKFILAQSSNLESIGDLTNRASAKQLQLGLNRSGTASFNIPITDEMADDLVPLSTCIKAYKNDVLIWSGPIWTIEESLPDNQINVSSVGWFEILNKRYTIDQKTYPAGTRFGEIMHDLIVIANADWDTWITAGADTSTAAFTLAKTYDRFINIGQEIIALSQIESGPDFTIDPLTREFDIVDTRQVDQIDAIFGYNHGPRNVSTVKRSTDSDSMANHIIAQGKFANVDTVDEDAIELYQKFTRVDSLSDVAELEVLGAWVNAEVVINRHPRVLITFTPSPEIGAEGLSPDIFTDYTIGDKVYLTAKYGNIQILGQPIRVFGVGISIDENGTETLSEIQATAT
jgi:hypothetical protein